MAMKKAVTLLLSAALLLAAVFPVYADQTRSDFSGVNINLPNITLELKGTGFDAETGDITATLGDSPLTAEDFHPYSSDKDSTLVYMMIDISGTTRNYQDRITSCINSYAGDMGDKDAMVLVTFGEKVKKTLEATNDTKKIADALDDVACNEAYTHLYDALDYVYSDAASHVTDYTRSYVIAFTDCEDDTQAGVTESEVKSKYPSHQLPLYIAVPGVAKKENTDPLGTIARESGGELAIVDSASDFEELTDSINDVSILKLKADNNNATGEEKNLSVSFGDHSYNMDVTVSKSVADNEAPTITDLTYDLQNNRFILTFSEKVTNASEKGAYSVVDRDGKKWSVADAEAPAASATVQLLMSEQIPNGTYTVTAEGLTDVSKQKNPLADSSKTIEVSGVAVSVDPETPEEGEFPLFLLILAIVGGLLLLGIAAIIVILLVRRKKEQQEPPQEEPQPQLPVRPQPPLQEAPPQPVKREPVTTVPPVQPPRQRETVINEYESAPPVSVKHHIKNENVVRVQLKVKTGNASEQVINADVVTSMIVGRSSICELYIDDPKLSRQHFVLENSSNELYITDLNSKNGTFVNGVRINSRRKLVNYDRIRAGLSEILVMIVK